jgi:aromatic-L-amino-acid decarboxylase
MGRKRTLEHVERQARLLDTGPDEMTRWLERLGGFSSRFLGGLPEAPAFRTLEGAVPLSRALPAGPADIDAVLAEYEAAVLASGMNPVSGRFFGYVPGGAVPSAAVGDFLAALTNRYSGVYLASPGAAEIENLAVEWLRSMVGYPPEAWGTLTSGGTLAALGAMVAIRESRPQPQWANGAFYTTGEIHHATPKALRTAGLAHVPLRTVRTDSELRMDVAHLRELVKADRAQGLRPWAVLSSAGTVNTGAVDPLTELAGVCREHGLWLHVDAAYGGFFALAEDGGKLVGGMEDADSVVLDPHKGLFLPYGCGAVLVRDGARLRGAFSFGGDYLEDVSDRERSSPADYSPELTRHFRALRLWMSLKLHGVERFRAALEEKLMLARHAYERLSDLTGLEMGPRPQLSIVSFRVRGEGDGATERLLKRILGRGRVHLSSTRLGGRVFLRMCILCFRSHLADVEAAIGEIEAALRAGGVSRSRPVPRGSPPPTSARRRRR